MLTPTAERYRVLYQEQKRIDQQALNAAVARGLITQQEFNEIVQVNTGMV